MVRPKGIEPSTSWLLKQALCHLSYGRLAQGPAPWKVATTPRRRLHSTPVGEPHPGFYSRVPLSSQPREMVPVAGIEPYDLLRERETLYH